MLGESGHRVTVSNRGITPSDLPTEIESVKATRGDGSLEAAMSGREFDVVLDMTTYDRNDALEAVETFRGKTARHIFISSGQVYLVREGAPRPFREESYAGSVMAAPNDPKDYDSWKYGVDKRDAEDVFETAWKDEGFPVTTLRLPMVASERDHYGRLQGYFARMLDGGPILIPDEVGLPIRHVYANDVARLIAILCDSSAGIGRAYNVSYGHSTILGDYLPLLGEIVGVSPVTLNVPRVDLESASLLPDCSPFSGTWMSELDAGRAARDLLPDNFEYTSPDQYLPAIFDDYRGRWVRKGLIPATYSQREREIDFASRLTSTS